MVNIKNIFHGNKYLLLFVVFGCAVFPANAATYSFDSEEKGLFLPRDIFETPLTKGLEKLSLLQEKNIFPISDLKNIKKLIEQSYKELQVGNKAKGLIFLEQAWAINPGIPVAGVLMAHSYLLGKEYSAALQVAKKIQKNSPNVAEGYTLAGLSYIATGEQKKAESSFEKAHATLPGNESAGFNLAMLYLKQGKIAKAKAVYKVVLDNYPSHLRIINSLAELEFISNERENAISRIESAILKYPDKILPRLLLPEMFLATKQVDKAMLAIDEIIKDFPDQPTVMEYVAVIFLKNGMPDKALNSLKVAIKVEPDIATLHYNLALAYEQLKQHEQALDEINIALRLDPKSVFSKFIHARLMASIGQFDDAKKLLKHLEKENPKSIKIPELRGSIAWAQNKTDEAIVHFKVALQNGTDDPLLVVKLATAQLKAKQIDAGFNTLRDWVKLHPNDIFTRFVLADRLLDSGYIDEAQSQYAEILKIKPDSINANNNIAWIYSKKGELDKALEIAENNFVRTPKTDFVLDTLAVILLKKGNHKRAVDLLQRAKNISPDNTAINYHLAKALIGTNNVEAKRILIKLLASDKSFKDRQSSKDLLQKLESD